MLFDLPYDVIVHIMSFYPLFDRWTLRLVCRLWNEAVKDPDFHVSKIVFPSSIERAVYPSICRRFGDHLVSLDLGIRNISPPVLDAIFLAVPNLESIRMTSILSLSLESWEKLVLNCPNLTSVTLVHTKIGGIGAVSDFIPLPRKLRHFIAPDNRTTQLHNLNWEQIETLHVFSFGDDVLPGSPVNLKSLHLWASAKEQILLEKAENLEDYSAPYSVIVPGTIPKLFALNHLANLATLKRLDLRSVLVGVGAIEHIITPMVNLELLDVRRFKNEFSEEEIAPLQERFPSLTILYKNDPPLHKVLKPPPLDHQTYGPCDTCMKQKRDLCTAGLLARESRRKMVDNWYDADELAAAYAD